MRIIAGKLKGLTLNTFEAENIRPTIDRVRENIFNKIQFGIMGSVVLDLFCGTGAISLEFLSRGAEKVYSVDNNSKSIKLINKNFEKAKLKPNLIIEDFKNAIKILVGKKFDYIFIDPPYDSGFGEESLKEIITHDLLKENSIIIYEHLVDTQFNVPKKLEIYDYKKYGTVAVSFLRLK